MGTQRTVLQFGCCESPFEDYARGRINPAPVRFATDDYSEIDSDWHMAKLKPQCNN